MATKREDIAIFWFRRDLRISDNIGLYHALNSGLKVLPVFIFDKGILDKLADKQDARVSFIHNRVSLLNNELQQYHSTVLTYYNHPLETFKEIIEFYSVKEVYTNNDYEPSAIKRDNEIAGLLAEHGIAFYSYKDQVIFEKGEILKSDKEPYTIFTPYKNQWKLRLTELMVKAFPVESYRCNLYMNDFKAPIGLEELGFIKSNSEYPAPMPDEAIIKNYEAQRNFPKLETTRIGVHLRFGTVSIRDMVRKALDLSDVWLNELIWREFFQMIIYHFPGTAQQAFKPAYDRIEWHNNEHEFECWCKGETGYPLVDAGMRELNCTGFMHNRVRMVTASFLCKNLLIDWRWGEAYFAEKLLDFDLAANVGNWQWAAGSGCDAAPYFRIFNPTLQAEKFDKNQEYIRKWVPEIGTPNYPMPMVDAKLTAKKTIVVYKNALNS
jgi:deoxyribodipyrimidine photo-lyase